MSIVSKLRNPSLNYKREYLSFEVGGGRGKKTKLGKLLGKKILTDGSGNFAGKIKQYITVCYPGGTFPSFSP